MSKLRLDLDAFALALAAFALSLFVSAPATAQEARDWPQLDLTLLAGATLSSANADRVDPIGLSLGATGIDLLWLGLGARIGLTSVWD